VNPPIVIHIGRTSDGCAYALNPSVRERLFKVPGALLTCRVFVGYPTQADCEADAGGVEWQVALLLTGISKSDLHKLGGVALHDPLQQSTTPLAE
jgi:hypothetical protein